MDGDAPGHEESEDLLAVTLADEAANCANSREGLLRVVPGDGSR